MPEIPRADVASLVKVVQSTTLLNRQLSTICQLNGLTSSGVKASLQQRIVNYIQEIVNRKDLTRFRQIEQSIRNTKAGHPHTTPSTTTPKPAAMLDYTNNAPAQPARSYFSGSNLNGGGAHSSLGHAVGYHGGSQMSLQFKPSPFYEIRRSVGPIRTCEAMSQHRNLVTIKIRASEHAALQQCITDKSFRVMVFCAGDKNGIQDIAFPHQSEVKVNGGEIKANLRGLKNKPGSTRPVDITDALRLKPSNYENNVELIYALTTKPFYVAVYLCKTTSVQDLAARIEHGKKIPKASVISEIRKEAADTDIVTTSQVLSLKCPLSYMRLAIPCRSYVCKHIQCFDATSYLQLQEQGPQWLCPICNKSATYDSLAIDEYVKDILANTSKDLEQVTIEPDAQWHAQSSVDDHNPYRGSQSAALDDDDDLEISEISIVGGRKYETPSRSLQGTATPTTRDSSSMPRGLGSVSGKRPAPQEFVDLTLDSDDDDAPPPRKKQHLSVPELGDY
ncbi:hypothetical protein BN1723_017082 [Verticillium longisporum]|uniref:MIZ zinc finger protein n=2 Tax=Verticillium TaxID=1036719 RepID=A0A2J8DQN6_VERDA|nr:Putative ATP-citrate synthase subunit 2 [Verticillium dahliae VDG2]KAG7111682.1 E3 SUMO-protein ligase pli1 like [Verticillium longisporum]KAH6694735.1 MIZ zinc finger protein [Verticillium dahliae]PNH32137.1 hypothetical protein BJF96_g4608 [Verticillium dahliae]PNH42285.1 hypothetical protein VD0004_g4965 [Verticillium dahliae]